jgi:hypothetical protein
MPMGLNAIVAGATGLVGSRLQFWVDYTYPYELAKAAAMNGIPDFVLVSSCYKLTISNNIK